MAANVHQYPISFTIPSDIKDLPTPYDDWCSFKDKKKWCGVKWVLELKESNGILQSTDAPIVSFPERDTITPFIHPLQESQEVFEIEIPPCSRLRGAFVSLFVERQYRCEVKMCMKSTPVIYAASLPDISLSIRPDVPNQIVMWSSLFAAVWRQQRAIGLIRIRIPGFLQNGIHKKRYMDHLT